MANINSSTAVSSASTLTTGTALQFFAPSNQPGETVLAELILTAAAETGTGTFTAFTVSGYEGGLTIVPTRLVAVIQAPLTFTAGTSPTVTAQLQVNSQAASAATAICPASGTGQVAGQVYTVTQAVTNGQSGVCLKSGDKIQVSLAPTGAPTNWSGSVKVLVFGVVVPA